MLIQKKWFCSELRAVCRSVASGLQNGGVWIWSKSLLLQRQTGEWSKEMSLPHSCCLGGVSSIGILRLQMNICVSCRYHRLSGHCWPSPCAVGTLRTCASWGHTGWSDTWAPTAPAAPAGLGEGRWELWMFRQALQKRCKRVSKYSVRRNVLPAWPPAATLEQHRCPTDCVTPVSLVWIILGILESDTWDKRGCSVK